MLPWSDATVHLEARFAHAGCVINDNVFCTLGGVTIGRELSDVCVISGQMTADDEERAFSHDKLCYATAGLIGGENLYSHRIRVQHERMIDFSCGAIMVARMATT
jgi:hypothetical protein